VQIAFQRNPDGPGRGIYLMNLDGTNVRELTFSETGDRWPEWAPDGSLLAFVRETDEPAVTDLYVVDPDSGEETYLVTETDAWWSYVWGPDASRIALGATYNGNTDIYVMASDGTGLTRLTTDPEVDHRPSWTQGGRIFFTSLRGGMGSEIYSMDETGGDQTPLTNNDVEDDVAVPSPDGSRVVFLRTEGGLEDLYVMNADGTDQVNITTAEDNLTGFFGACWSPDGQYVAFTAVHGLDHTIRRVNADGTGMIDLTDGQGEDRDSSWTPDSQRIVFGSKRDGIDGEIYIMDADGSNQTRLTNDPAYDSGAVVQPAP